MDNTKIWTIISANWRLGYGITWIQVIFDLKLLRIPLIRNPFSYWHFVTHHSRYGTRLAQLGILPATLRCNNRKVEIA